MDINEITQNSKLHRAILKSKKLKRPNHWNMQSGRFPHLPRFTKLQNFLLESFYTISDMHNPSAYRLYLYLLRQITGYKSRGSIEYRPKKIKYNLNMGNSFYNAVKCLEGKNMIYFVLREEIKYIALNPYPESWITDSKEKIDEIINNEINALLGITKDELISSSSSSKSKSSSSSQSYPSDDILTDDLLRELDAMDEIDPKPKQRFNKEPEPLDPELLEELDNM